MPAVGTGPGRPGRGVRTSSSGAARPVTPWEIRHCSAIVRTEATGTPSLMLQSDVESTEGGRAARLQTSPTAGVGSL